MIRFKNVFIALLVLAVGVPVKAEAPDVEPVLMEELFLKARGSGQEERGLRYETLINCLVFYESSGDHNAIGDDGRARGVLQFWEATWNMYCSDYGSYETATAKEQKLCADEMISEDWTNVEHWSTIDLCLQ